MNEMMDYFKKAGWRRSVFCVAGNIPLGLGVPGIWIALVVEWIVRAVALHARMRGQAWMHAKTE